MKSHYGQGSVFQREENGKWIARRRWIDELGRSRERSFTCDSEVEAKRKLSAFNRELVKGAIRSSAEPTLKEWSAEAMETIFKAKVRASTFCLYEGLIKNHISKIGGVKLSDLTIEMIEGLWADPPKDQLHARRLSRATKHQIRRLMINLLNHAVRRRKIRENVAKYTAIVDRERPITIRALTAAEAQLLLKNVENQTYRCLFTCQLMLGLRIGEALGMKWSDLAERSVMISRQIQRDRLTGKLTEQDLKTQRSRRKLPLPDALLKEINLLPRNGEFIFASRSGTPIEPRNAQRALYKAASASGLQDVSTHVLRHTYATLSVSNGVGINVISNALGHTHLRTTMIYAGSTEEVIRDANDKLSALLVG